MIVKPILLSKEEYIAYLRKNRSIEDGIPCPICLGYGSNCLGVWNNNDDSPTGNSCEVNCWLCNGHGNMDEDEIDIQYEFYVERTKQLQERHTEYQAIYKKLKIHFSERELRILSWRPKILDGVE